MEAVISPTICLSAPSIVSLVFSLTVTVMPSGFQSHRMGFTERKVENLALEDSTETNTFDLNLLLIAFNDTGDHVVDDGTRGAIHSAGMTTIIGGAETNLIVSDFNFDRASKVCSSLPLGPSARTVCPSTVTVALSRMGTGSFPILLIVAAFRVTRLCIRARRVPLRHRGAYDAF